MNPRIEKKVSKRLVEIAPKMFRKAWKCECESEFAESQSSTITGCMHVGGGLDYWGDGQEAYSALEYLKFNWDFLGNFPINENDHYPDTGNFKPTTRNLMKLAREHG